MSSSAVTKRVVSSSHPDSLLPLRALAVAAGLSTAPEGDVHFSSDPVPSSDASSSSSSSSISMEMTVSSYNPFNGASLRATYRGYAGIARAICSLRPESGLWGETGALGVGNDDDDTSCAVEGWCEIFSTDLSGAAFGADDDRVKDPHYVSSVSSLASVVEKHLFDSDRTYLVGERATAADVLGAILLAGACVRVGGGGGGLAVPQQTKRWCDTVLGNGVLVDALGGEMPVSPTCGKESPMEKKTAVEATTTTATTVEKAKEAAPIKEKKKEKRGDEKREESSSKETVPSPATTTAPAPAAPAASAPASAAPPADLSDNAVLNKLDSLNLPHRTYSHVPCTTAEDLIENVPLSDPVKETHTKNLFLKDKKHGMFLVTVSPTADVNTKELGRMLKLEGKVNLRLASEDLLSEVLGCKKGCVGPLAIMKDSEKKVTLVLDENLMGAETVHSHPLTNDASTAMAPADLKKFLEAVGVEPVYLPFEKKAQQQQQGGEAGGKAPASRPVAEKKPKQPKQPKQPKKGQAGETHKKKESKDKKGGKKGETLLALKWKREENFAMWYSDIIVLSEMISYYDISGCYILRPWSYNIWEHIQTWFNGKIRALDVDNAYFPLFVSQDRLEKEKDHVEGFAPEVAWVTKSGESDLVKPIAIRPTSETIMYPAYSDWIKSHRDLPLKLNQWANVVRWEFKDPTPFLRSREFLWQEGHTAHATYDDAQVMVRQALELYRGVYEDLLAVPVIPGYKTEKEKFAGGFQTTTVEAYIPLSGRAIQGATSHNLGQNFGKMFDIKFQDEGGETQIAWQTSWGLTTRTIGVMVMVHGDDTGLVLPPAVAPLQAVIVPIVSKKCTMEDLDPYCRSLLDDLTGAGVRAKFDDRDMYNPGWKYNHWEQKGVPIRIEVGPRDVENRQARVVIRHSGEKIDLPVEGMGLDIRTKLTEIQSAMFEKARGVRDAHVVKVTEWKDFVPNLELHNLVLTPWCGPTHQDWEEKVKNDSREESLSAKGEVEEEETTATSVAAKTLCIPFDQPELPKGTKCFASGLEAECWVLWGRSY